MIRAGLIIVLVQGTLLFSQVAKLPDASRFKDAIYLSFEDLPIDSRADNGYSALGVTFDGEDQTAPTIVAWNPGDTWGADVSLRNVGEASAQPESALIIRFRYPVSKFGISLANGSEDTVATIQAYAPNGEFLGEIEQGGIDENNPIFVGLETSNKAGVATVVLDYGDGAAEQVNSLRFSYTEPRTFRSYFPQIGNGRVGENLSWRSVLQFQGLVELQETEVVLTLFDQSGEPLELDLSGEKKNIFEFTLIGRGVRRMMTDGSSEELVVGYASIESSLPIAAQAIVRSMRAGGELISEASVAATECPPVIRIPVERNPVESLDSGVAVVNVGRKESRVIFVLRDEKGEKPEEIRNAPTIFLQPGEHQAVFLTELFDFLVDTPFFGSLTILSQEPAAVTSLRTYKGVAWSSLPVGSTQK